MLACRSGSRNYARRRVRSSRRSAMTTESASTWTPRVQRFPPNSLEDLLQDVPGALEELAAMDPIEKTALQLYADEVGEASDQLTEEELDALAEANGWSWGRKTSS